MIIGYLSLEIYLPYSHSLKEKRQRLKRIRDRLRNKYNVAFAELDFQNKWQRSKIGIVTISNQKTLVEKIFNQIIKDVIDNIDGEVINTHQEYL